MYRRHKSWIGLSLLLAALVMAMPVSPAAAQDDDDTYKGVPSVVDDSAAISPLSTQTDGWRDDRA
jgi:hypothetical protein